MSNQSNLRLICNRYRLEAVITDTEKTKIYSVTDETGLLYAAKLTCIHETGGGSFHDEFEVFRSLTNGQISFGRRSNGQTPQGFPNVYYVGTHANEYNVIVMDMLSPDLLHLYRNRNLCLRECQSLACEMLDCLEDLHRHGFVHRDVKPQNYMLDKWGKVHLIDFGLSKRFRDVRSNTHLPQKREPFLIGTLIYSSLNAQRLVTQSRRDDLESLGYSVIEMITKRLPWEEACYLGGDVYRRLCHMKETTTIRTLCRGLPRGIFDYMITVYGMSYEETPKYSILRKMLNSE